MKKLVYILLLATLFIVSCTERPEITERPQCSDILEVYAGYNDLGELDFAIHNFGDIETGEIYVTAFYPEGSMNKTFMGLQPKDTKIGRSSGQFGMIIEPSTRGIEGTKKMHLEVMAENCEGIVNVTSVRYSDVPIV